MICSALFKHVGLTKIFYYVKPFMLLPYYVVESQPIAIVSKITSQKNWVIVTQPCANEFQSPGMVLHKELFPSICSETLTI